MNLRAQRGRECVQNFGVLQASFEDDGPAMRLLEISLQDDVEFIQRSKDLFDADYIGPVMEISEAGGYLYTRADIVASRSLAFGVAGKPRVSFDSTAKGHSNKSTGRVRGRSPWAVTAAVLASGGVGAGDPPNGFEVFAGQPAEPKGVLY
nr:microtubule-associated protein RP/EB family member 1-like [Dermacentor andersoni]